MNADLAVMLDLQEADLALDALLKERCAIPASLRRVEEELAKKNTFAVERRAHLEKVKRERVQKEKDLDFATSKLADREASLKAIKSNEAYQAALKELEQTRQANSLIEDEVLNLMEEVDGVAREIAGIEEEVRRKEQDLAAERVRMEAALRDVDARIACVGERAKALASQANSTLLASYQRVRGRRGGAGLAQTMDERCLACHMEIPPQMYNELIKGERHHSCPSCHRVLYFRQETVADDQPEAAEVRPDPEP